MKPDRLGEEERKTLSLWADGVLDLSQDILLARAGRALRVIVASQFGWSAVSSEPMSIHDFLLAAQLMSEERVGKPHRDYQRSLAEQDKKGLASLERFK
jgi:hypothetical protein